MNNTKLSILLITVPERFNLLEKLIKELDKQRRGLPVEVLYLGDVRTLNVGAKRNILKNMVNSEYSVWIDDDDWVEPNYIEEIMKGIEQKPDVITFNNQVFMRDYAHHHPMVEKVIFKLEHKKRTQDLPNKIYYYLPCHTHAIKHSIVKRYDFPDITYGGADFKWSEAIQHELKTEYHIDKQLYHHRIDFSKDKQTTSLVELIKRKI